MAPVKCGVCVDAESKYKCPICLTPYCSLSCYQTHKKSPCSKELQLPAAASHDEELSFGQLPRSFVDENEERDQSGWRLTQSQLEILAASSEIQQVLRDEALQMIVQRVDSSLTPEQELDRAMESAAFREFTDKILAKLK